MATHQDLRPTASDEPEYEIDSFELLWEQHKGKIIGGAVALLLFAVWAHDIARQRARHPTIVSRRPCDDVVEVLGAQNLRATLKGAGVLKAAATPLTGSVSAVSVGITDGTPMLDLAYVEDVRAETDMNVVMTGAGGFVEVQGTAEGAPFSEEELLSLLKLAKDGVSKLVALQKAAVA